MSKETKKWWEACAEGYQKTSKIPIDIHYGPGAPNEKGMRLLGNLKGKNVLEIGCGGAQCGIAMAKQGAKVTGVDISKEQLKFAKNLADKNKVKLTFIQSDIENLSKIKSSSQDIVFTAWALHYVKNLKNCFKEAYRVLKKGGFFVLSIPHPFSRMMNSKTLKPKESYFDTGRYAEKKAWKDGTIHVFVMYNYTISQVVNGLLDAGFKIEKMIEPDSRKRYKGDPWYGLWDFNPRFMKFIPHTLIFKVRKK